MQVAYSGTSGRVPRYACVRAHHLHGTDHSCQSLGGTRLERAIATAFLDAVTPAGIRASAQAIAELEQQHDERLAGQRLAVERAEFEAGRARRQFDACEPEHRLVARTLEARLETALSELGVAETTIYRWLRAGLLPGEQTTPHAPWRIRLSDEIRARFVPDIPDGYLPLDQAAKALGVARQTVLHKVQRGELHAVQVVNGRRKGLRDSCIRRPRWTV